MMGRKLSMEKAKKIHLSEVHTVEPMSPEAIIRTSWKKR